MPELPEVEVVRQGLAPVVAGATVLGVDVLDERALTRHVAGAADFVGRLEGATLRAPARRGKFLWVPISAGAGAPDHALLAHLGMSGQLLIRDPAAPDDRHGRIRLRLDGPAGRYDVVFVDQRTFGSLAVDALVPLPTGEGLPAQALHIARDPLDAHFELDAVLDRLARRRSPIKSALLDQSLVSGIGNIYADESLWRARVHPTTLAADVSRRTARALFGHVRDVLQLALAEGGTSFDAQYVNVNGQAGYFAHSLNAYGRHGMPCPRCGTLLVRVPFQNRSSHVCPRCQRRR